MTLEAADSRGSDTRWRPEPRDPSDGAMGCITWQAFAAFPYRSSL